MKVPTFKTIKHGLKKNSPEILFGMGLGGMILTTVLAVRATPKAMKKIDEAKKESENGDISKKEVVKACWTCYAPAAGSMIFSVTCLVESHSINRKRLAATAAAYSLTDTAFRTYQEKAVDILGEKKEQKIREAAAVEKVKTEPIEESIINIGNGNTLCYDVITGRYFRSDIEFIRQAVNNINYRMRYDDYISLNDFFEELLLPPVEIGHLLGWHIKDGYLDVEFTSKLSENGTPCLVLDYVAAPRYNYDTLH